MEIKQNDAKGQEMKSFMGYESERLTQLLFFNTVFSREARHSKPNPLGLHYAI